MRRLRINRKCRRQLRAACAGLLLIAAASLLACGAGSGEVESGYEAESGEFESEAAELEPIKGTDVKRVVFSAEGAEQVGIQTAAIRQNGQGKVIPYAALIYDPEGNTFAYTSPEPLVYVREKVEIDRVDGDSVVLSGGGPPLGTKVVTVGAAEVYGTEFEVAH